MTANARHGVCRRRREPRSAGIVVVAVVAGPIVAWILPRVAANAGRRRSANGGRRSRLPGRHRAPRRRWFGRHKIAQERFGAVARGLVAASLLAATGCAAIPTAANPFATAPPPEPAPATLSVRTLGTIPQPSGTQFVEGLDALPDGNLVEATGAVDGQPSRLMVLDPATGRVLRQVDVTGVFAEGLAVVHGLPGRPPSIWLLTWRDQVALHYSTELALLATVPLTNPTGQSWGICFDGHELITSDGSATLTRRSPTTLEATGAFTVTAAGRPTIGLNELDCTDGVVWANQFPTGPGLSVPVNSGNTLLAIDPYTGRAGAAADLATLQQAEHPADGDPNAVPNGVVTNTDGTAWITGKSWRDLVHVRLEPTSQTNVAAPGTRPEPPR